MQINLRICKNEKIDLLIERNWFTGRFTLFCFAMNEIITSYIKWVLFLSMVSYGAIYYLFIVPEIKMKRVIYWSEWFGLNFNWFSCFRVREYKEVCIDKGMSLIFYKIYWGILWFTTVNITLGFIIMMSM